MDLTQKKNLAESENLRLLQELSSLGQEHELVKNQTQKLSIEKQENQTEIQRLKKISGIKDNPKKGTGASVPPTVPGSARPSTKSARR